MTGRFTAARARIAVLAIHLAVLAGGLVFVWGQASDILAQKAAVAQARGLVEALDARLAGTARPAAATEPSADPFLPGASATVAGANLQDRVVSAIRKAGGSVTSSQVDTTQAGATPPVIVLTLSCQLAGPALQALLYGLESQAPDLFLDQLVIETATPDVRPSAVGDDTLKMSMTVSAFWNGAGKT